MWDYVYCGSRNKKGKIKENRSGKRGILYIEGRVIP